MKNAKQIQYNLPTKYLVKSKVMQASIVKIKFISFILLLEVFLSQSSAQTSFNKNYTYSLEGIFKSAILLHDGNYAAIGQRFWFDSLGHSYGVLELVKTNSSGDTLWTKYFLDPYTIYSFIKTDDHGFFICGIHVQDSVFSYPYILKLDSVGNIEWHRDIRGTNVYKGIQTIDDGFIVAGNYTDSINHIGIALTKFDLYGNFHWKKNIIFHFVSGFSAVSDLIETLNGELIISCYITSVSYHGGVLTKTDSSGSIVFVKGYELIFGMGISSIALTENNGLILLGRHTDSNFYGDPTLIRTDSSGTVLWARDYFLSPVNEYSICMVYDTLQRCTFSFISDLSHSSLVQVNSIGQPIWAKTFSYSNTFPQIKSIQSTPDSGFIIGATSDDSSFRLIKTPGDGNTICMDSSYLIADSSVQITATNYTNQSTTLSDTIDTLFLALSDTLMSGIYTTSICMNNSVSDQFVHEKQIETNPNPFTDKTTIEFYGNYYLGKEYLIFDIAGRKVKNEKIGRFPIIIERQNLKNGIYILCVLFENGSRENIKLIIE